MTAVSTEPRALDRRLDDVDPTHFICDIHEDLALCGEQLDPDGEVLDNDEDAECPLCMLAWDAGRVCVVPGCPGRVGVLRRFWRWLW